jgi:hypothetical protein
MFFFTASQIFESSISCIRFFFHFRLEVPVLRPFGSPVSRFKDIKELILDYGEIILRESRMLKYDIKSVLSRFWVFAFGSFYCIKVGGLLWDFK